MRELKHVRVIIKQKEGCKTGNELCTIITKKE